METKFRNFKELLQGSWADEKQFCGGLDPDISKTPRREILGVPLMHIGRLITDVVDATEGVCGIYKPQVAFYECWGGAGLDLLRDIVTYIKEINPAIPIILDAKRGDIGTTNQRYVEMLLWLGVDAVTLHNYIGYEAMKVFTSQANLGCIFMCKTSNPGAGEFQDLMTFDKGADPSTAIPLCQRVAYNVSHNWNVNNNCGLVVGATYPNELKIVRKIVGDGFPLLMPGVGAQDGKPEDAVLAGRDSKGQGMIINASSSFLHASKNTADYVEAAYTEATRIDSLIRNTLANVA